MAKGISIDFAANVNKFLGGTRDVEKALDDVADSLDDLAREGEKAGDKAGDSLKDGLDDAGDAAKKLERKFKDAFDEVKKGSRKAGDDLGDNVKRGAGKAEQGLDEFKDEARQTARETAASFDGTADSLVDMAQETAANALGGFGPLGAAAGIALAAGAGAMYSAYQEKAEATKQLIADMFDDMIASGNDFASAEIINTQLQSIVADDELVRVYTAAAGKIGVSVSEALAAAAGDPQAMEVVGQAAQLWLDGIGADAGSARTDVQGLSQAIEAQGSAVDSASSRARLYRDAAVTSGDALADWAQAQADVNDIIDDTNTALMDNGKAYADNADQLRTENVAVLTEMASKLGDVNQAAVDAGVKGAELAAVQREQYDAFMAAATGAGMARDDAEKLAAQYGLIPTDVDTQVTVSGGPAARTEAEKTAAALRTIQDRNIKIGVQLPDLPSVQFQVDRLASGIRQPVIGVNVIGGRVVK